MNPSLAARILESIGRSDVGILYRTPLEALGTTPPAILDRLQEQIGAPLPLEVRSFYLGAERLYLLWQQGPAEETKDQPSSWSDVCDPDGPFWSKAVWPSRILARRGGTICIPPAAEVFQKDAWIGRVVPRPTGREITLDGAALPDRSLYEDLYPFDFIGSYYRAGLWLDRQRNDWRVVLGSDHGACWTDYKTLSVAEYLEQIEVGWGGLRWVTPSYADEPQELWGLPREE